MGKEWFPDHSAVLQGGRGVVESGATTSSAHVRYIHESVNVFIDLGSLKLFRDRHTCKLINGNERLTQMDDSDKFFFTGVRKREGKECCDCRTVVLS